ncbi:MAG: UDP-2,4-diacetamido-2,4,6-trideoxy-beta-L-altropyranose hydrolase [Epsilonproteobacteria bacterium]|nr:UDP-2,4-diacetamido-2,4,6-trideoxy-beta-L-altropyranose hydrolase [Campylobacterota bacterium]
MNLLRVDFSAKRGFGHLKRSLRFLKKYKNFQKWVIVCKECGYETPLEKIKIDSEKEFFELVKKFNPKEVIVDNYNFTYPLEKEFKTRFPKVKLIAFDDLCNPHYVDEIINPNPYVKKSCYKSLPPFTKVTLIPPLVPSITPAKKRGGVFVSFGATDAKGIGLKVLKKLKGREKIEFYTTSANRNLKELRRFCARRRWCKLHIDKDVTKGLAKAKKAIITPSTLAWEVMEANLPFVAIEVARNQKLISKYLRKRRVKVWKRYFF